MDRLGDEIKKTARRVGLPAASEVVRVWPSVVGETIAANAWPARLSRRGVLQVNTSSATWAFELKHLAPRILPKLKEALVEECPSELHFVPGPVPSEGRETGKPLVPAAPAPTEKERARAEELAAEIDDEELRVLVARAAAASLANSTKRSSP